MIDLNSSLIFHVSGLIFALMPVDKLWLNSYYAWHIFMSWPQIQRREEKEVEFSNIERDHIPAIDVSEIEIFDSFFVR